MRYAPERYDEVACQSRRAAEILGVSDLRLLDYPDQRLDTVPVSEIAGRIERIIGEFQPDIVYTHSTRDLNRDHRTLTEAVLIACRPYSAPSVREILMFETPSSTEWGTSQLFPAFEPVVFVNVEEFIEIKIEAFCCYTAEVRPYPHPRSPEAIRERARYWGSQVNRRAAEPFALVRGLR